MAVPGPLPGLQLDFLPLVNQQEAQMVQITPEKGKLGGNVS